MLEFIKEYYILLDRIIVIIPAIVGIILYKKFKNTTVKYFIWFLIYVNCYNFLGSYPRYFENYDFFEPLKNYVEGTVFEKNHWWFTLFWEIGKTVFFTFFYQKILHNERFIKFLKFIRQLFLISSIIYLFIFWKELSYSGLVFIECFSAIAIIISIVFYFIELLNSDKINNFYKTINFWISVILFLWLLIVTPISFFNIYFNTSDWNFILLQWQVYLLANLFMYIGFASILIFGKPEKSINN
ncbi:hypothetical protein [Winogradskyella immobilis]|uniref:Lycopene cyclase domain-containing protein n=1 Tax=Winogradskyella immobilis TaxID=2816852 RepID=A0ABS8EL67_9FLAO|nr:hypothetical protein [Winogradskyella immobilis]MCC1483671.1 hypothetical protein [Winogradskyella immobilis]MCG0015765.1 hypothetical protein [Winogradskyella immobilis]